MRITPLEIQQKRFTVGFRGLDRAEVDAYLNLIASELESMTREIHELREDQNRNHRLLDEYRARESAIKETMITAQRVTDELHENAKKEADIIIGRAELEAEKMMERAQSRLTDLLGDIAEAKRQKAQLLAGMKGMLDAHAKMTDIAEESEKQPGLEEKLAVMRRAPPKERESEGQKPEGLRTIR